MAANKLQQWLEQIRKTLPEEISCSECFDWISTYVDLEQSGQPAALQMPQLKSHLDQCGVCHQEYELLRALAQVESQDSPPSLEELQECLRNKLSGLNRD